MLGHSTISNQPVEGSIQVIAVSVISIGKPLTSIYLVITEYDPNRSILIYDHGSTSATLDDSLPYLHL